MAFKRIGKPLPDKTEDLIIDADSVSFINFAVGQAIPLDAHKTFIKEQLVPWYITQIEQNGLRKQVLQIFPIGAASATGKPEKNTKLARDRAQAIGDFISVQFDDQKGASDLAKNQRVVVTVTNDQKKDQLMYKLESDKLKGIPPTIIERASNKYRRAIIGLSVIPEITDADKVINCRQLLGGDLKVTKVPGNLLEQKLNELEDKLPGYLKAAGEMGFGWLKGKLVDLVKKGMTEFGASQPELTLIFKEIEFLVPSDLALMFEFQDKKGRAKKYQFNSSANKVGFDLIEAVGMLLSITKWATKLPEELEEINKKLKRQHKNMNATEDLIENLEKFIETTKGIGEKASKLFDFISKPDSIARRMLGNGLVDTIVNVVNGIKEIYAGKPIAETDWAKVKFDSAIWADIMGFSNQIAWTTTFERLGDDTTVLLEFAPEKNQPLLGFHAQTTIVRKWSLGLTIGSFELAKGHLIPAN